MQLLSVSSFLSASNIFLIVIVLDPRPVTIPSMSYRGLLIDGMVTVLVVEL